MTGDEFMDRAIPEPNSGCWLWIGNVDPSTGYGRFGHLNESAHRASYEMHVRPIPEGLQIDHLCRVRCCVNPKHLEPVTREENLRRGLGVGPAVRVRVMRDLARTGCRKGHPYPEDVPREKDGSRKCRECHRQSQANYMKRKLG